MKRVYFLSLEYILGRQMQSNLLNNDLEANYREALRDIGYDLVIIGFMTQIIID